MDENCIEGGFEAEDRFIPSDIADVRNVSVADEAFEYFCSLISFTGLFTKR